MTPANDLRMGRQEWALLFLLSFLWGGSFVFAKLAVAALPPLTIVFLRVALAALFLAIILAWRGRAFPSDFKTWRDFLILGALNNALPFSLIFWGQTRIESGLAAILNATTPIFAVIAAHIFTRDEKANGRKIAGVLCGLAGVAILVGFDYLAELGHHLAAELAVIGAAISYSGAGIWGRRFRGLDPNLVACGQLSASSLLMAPIILICDRPWELAMPEPPVIAAILALALFSTALAYAIFFRILARAGATNLLLVTFLIPASALLLGFLLLGEGLAWQQGVGLLGIGLGLAFIDGRLPASLLAKWRARQSASSVSDPSRQPERRG